MNADDAHIDMEIQVNLVSLKRLFDKYRDTLPTDDDDETYLDSKSRWECEAETFLGWLEKSGVLSQTTVDADEEVIARIEAKFLERLRGSSDYGDPIFVPKEPKK